MLNKVTASVLQKLNAVFNFRLDAGFLTTPALFDGHCKVNDGSKDTVDSLLKFTRVAPLHGNFKMFVDNLIESQGEYTLDGKATGVASARFLQLNSVIKGMRYK